MADYWAIFNNVADWFSENEWAGELLNQGVKQALYSQPELDYDKLMEMAIQDAVINSPDVYTPAGSSITTVDPETGKRVVTQEYNPQVQQLFDMLVRSAGSDAPTYRKPENYDAIHGALINRREEHLGLPQSTFQPWQNGAPRGVSGIDLMPGSDPDPEDD